MCWEQAGAVLVLDGLEDVAEVLGWIATSAQAIEERAAKTEEIVQIGAVPDVAKQLGADPALLCDIASQLLSLFLVASALYV